jgi:hypothetical protein
MKPRPIQDRTWVTEADPALSREDGPLQVLSTKKGGTS